MKVRFVAAVAMVLFARDTYRAGVDLGKLFHVRGRAVDRNATQWRLR